jgi:hypothetical protein
MVGANEPALLVVDHGKAQDDVLRFLITRGKHLEARMIGEALDKERNGKMSNLFSDILAILEIENLFKEQT